jgi:hypothetical protein
MFSPVMNTTLVGVLLWTFNVLCFGPIVKRLRRHMGHVPKPIPLRPTLCVQTVFIVVSHACGSEGFDFVLEDFPTKGWDVGDVQRKVKRYDLPRLNLFRSSRNTGWGEKVEATYLHRKLAVAFIFSKMKLHSHWFPRPKLYLILAEPPKAL